MLAMRCPGLSCQCQPCMLTLKHPCMQSKLGPENHLYPRWGTYRAKKARPGSQAEAGASAEELADEAALETTVHLAQLLRQALGQLYPRKAVDSATLTPPTVGPPLSCSP